MKNRGMHPIGTRVHIAQDKFIGKVGTVVEYTEDGEHMCVHWDGDFICDGYPRITSGFSPMELKEVRNGRDESVQSDV